MDAASVKRSQQSLSVTEQSSVKEISERLHRYALLRIKIKNLLRRAVFDRVFKLKQVCFRLRLQCNQSVHILIRITLDIIRVFISTTRRFITSNRGSRFPFLLHSEMFLEENFTKLCEILRVRAIHFLGCVPFSPSPCLLMTSFQYCCSVLDSRMLTCLSALTHAVCIAPERHYCRELHLAEQNNFCYLFQGGVCLCCSWNWRRDVSGWNQYTKQPSKLTPPKYAKCQMR